MSKLVLVIEVNDDAATVASALAPTGVAGNPFNAGADAWSWVNQLGSWIEGQQLSGRGILISYADTGVSASTTGTFTGAPTAADTITINGVVFTARASGAVADEFNIGSTVTATASALVAAINASTTTGILNTVRATSAAGVVTFYSVVPGPGGKNIPITESLDNFTLAAVTLSTGGTQAHNATIEAGFAVPTAS